MACTVEKYLSVFQGWLGRCESNGSHKAIIDIYNSHSPLPMNYKVRYNDAWCDTTVSAAAIVAGCSDIIGKECGVERHVAIWKKMGIWDEDGSRRPKPGDIIVFSWRTDRQPNNAFADHVGIVESVNNNSITTIEGNNSSSVRRRVIPIGWGYIRGYAHPKYLPSTGKKSVTDIAKEVLKGKWGNGADRVKNLTNAGYDPVSVQNEVNRLCSNKPSKSVTDVAKEVLKGKWGNGSDRVKNLKKAGYDPVSVQKEVNRLLS